MGVLRTLRDASGRLRTADKWLIRKRPGASRSATSPCQGGSRGFDPRFPLHTNLHTQHKLGARLKRSASRVRAREFKDELNGSFSSLFRRLEGFGRCFPLVRLPPDTEDQDARPLRSGVRNRQDLGEIKTGTLAKWRQKGKGPKGLVRLGPEYLTEVELFPASSKPGERARRRRARASPVPS
jgi:hypothetical protein